MLIRTLFGPLLTPDPEQSGGGDGAGGGTLTAEAPEQAGTAGESQVEGAPLDDAGAPAPEAKADPYDAAWAKAKAETGQVDTQDGSDGANDPASGTAELISDSDLADLLSKIRGGGSAPAEPVVPAAGSDDSTATTPAGNQVGVPEGKAPITKPDAAPDATDPLAYDEAELDLLADEFGETKPLVGLAKAQAKTIKDLTDRLNKIEQQTKQAEKQAQERAHFEQVVAPVMRMVDRIPGLDEARFGRFDGEAFTPQQIKERNDLTSLAVVMAKQMLADQPIPTSLPIAEQRRRMEAIESKACEAAHRTLIRGRDAAAESKPTTRAAVIGDLRKQHNARSPMSAATTTRPGPAPVYSKGDDGPTAVAKVMQKYGVKPTG